MNSTAESFLKEFVFLKHSILSATVVPFKMRTMLIYSHEKHKIWGSGSPIYLSHDPLAQTGAAILDLTGFCAI